MQLLDNLNSSQKEAVQSTEGPLMVLAGAGSGKTRVITQRIAYILKKLQVPASKILALTFTNKAANEMKERVLKIIGRTQGLSVSTFHSFGVRFLKEEKKLLGYDQFSIFSQSDCQALIKNLILELNLDETKYPPKLLSFLISQAKNNLQYPDEVLDLTDAVFRQIYTLYQERLKSLNAFDFDDLIFLPVKLMQKNPDILKKWSQKFHYIMVDEYQDTNHTQYLLMKQLSSFHQNICVVGDDDQSIYAFRGAKVENILNFEKDFRDTKVITLNKNYRSTPQILECAYALIDHNKNRHPKKVSSHLDEGDNIVFFHALDPEDEASWIAEQIFSLRDSKKFQYHNQAVLCRTNTQMRVFEKTFREKNIPYRLIGGYSFFDRAIVKNILAYLKVFNNQKDSPSLLRTLEFPRKGIGVKSIETVKEYASLKKFSLYDSFLRCFEVAELNKKTIHKIQEFMEKMQHYCKLLEDKFSAQTIHSFIKDFGFVEEIKRTNKDEKELEWKIELVAELLDIAENYEKKSKNFGEIPTLDGFITALSLNNKDDDKDDEELSNKVPVMTIHASKGLEFSAVFIPGFEDEILPHKNSLAEKKLSAIEEERRLAYVAITRAKLRLFISACQRRRVFNEGEKEKEISMFFDELPNHLVGEEEFDDNLALQRLKALKASFS